MTGAKVLGLIAALIAIAMIIIAVLEALFGFFGLFSEPKNPQYLEFQYKIVKIPPGARAQLSADLASGVRSFTDRTLGGPANCEYLAMDTADDRDLDGNLNNSQTVVSITIEADLEPAALTSCLPGTPPKNTFVAELFNISASMLPVTGTTTNTGTGSVVLKSPTTGTKLFEVNSESLHYEFVLDSYNHPYGVGTFEFLTTRPDSDEVLMAYDGRFALD